MPVIPLHGAPIYQGEVLLLGWSENNRDGMTVRLALDATDEGTHPFKGLGTGKMGQRFMMVAVPLGDDDQPQIEAPAAPTPAAQAPAAGKSRPAGQKWDECKYAKQVSTACGSKDGEFRAWLSRRGGFANVLAPDAAVAEVKRILGIESRTELDADEEKASRWSRLYGQYQKHRDELIGQEQAEAQAAAYLGGRR